MSQQALDTAQELAIVGDYARARELAAPFLSDDELRAQAIYVLALCVDGQGGLATACYLFAEAAIVSGDPGYVKQSEECQARMDDAGLVENFRDAGHNQCPHCQLHYRAEHRACPYCVVAEPEPDGPPPLPGEEDSPETEDLEWEDSIFDKAEKLGQEAIDRARHLAESETVQELAERAKVIGSEAKDKAREIAEKEQVKEAAERAKKIGREASKKARELSEHESVREAKVVVQDTSEKVADRVGSYIRSERAKFNYAGEAERINMVAKWVLFGALILLLISLLRAMV